MIYFEIEPLQSICDARFLSAIAESYTLAQGFFSLSDLVCDENALTEWYIDQADPRERPDLRSEPQHALRFAYEAIEATILEEVAASSALLGAHYPFTVAPAPGVLLELKAGAEIDIFAWCYFAMQLHGLDQEGLISFRALPGLVIADPRKVVRRAFYNLFEVIAGIAVANHIGGVPSYFSDCRSSKKLLRRLQRACTVFKTGAPKRYEDLHVVEAAANDGGIDIVVARIGYAGLQATALVGATVQVSDIRGKVVDETVVSRFLGYLKNHNEWRPAYGILVHPDPHSMATHYQAAEGNCEYVARHDILQNLHPVASSVPLYDRTNKIFKQLANAKLKKLAQLRIQIGFDQILLGPEPLA